VGGTWLGLGFSTRAGVRGAARVWARVRVRAGVRSTRVRVGVRDRSGMHGW